MRKTTNVIPLKTALQTTKRPALDLSQPTDSYFDNYVFHKLTDRSAVVTITRALMRDSRSLYRIRDAVSDALDRLEAAGLVTRDENNCAD